VQLRFQDQDFSWKFLLADVAFPTVFQAWIFCDFTSYLLILKAMLCWIARAGGSPVRRSPALPRRPWWSAFRSHTSPPRRPHPWSTPPDQSSPEQPPLRPTPPDQPAPDQFYLHSTLPDRLASWERDRLGWPTAACWRRLWSAHQSGYNRRSAMTWYTTSSHMGRPSLPSFGSWTARSWRPLRLNSSSWRRTV
jgi:hypothetical protein